MEAMELEGAMMMMSSVRLVVVIMLRCAVAETLPACLGEAGTRMHALVTLIYLNQREEGPQPSPVLSSLQSQQY